MLLTITIILKNIQFRPVRSFLTIFGIASACCVYILLLYSIDGFEHSWNRFFHSRGMDLFIMEKSKVDPLTSSLDSSIVKSIRNHPASADAAGSLADIVSLENGTNLIVLGYDPDSFYFEAMKIRGDKPTKNNQAILGVRAANNLDISVGQSLELDFKSFRVVGVFKASNIFESNAVIIPIDTLRTMRGIGDIYSTIGVRLKENINPQQAIEDIKTSLREHHPKASVSQTADFLKQSQMFQAIKQLSNFIGLLALVMIILIVMNTFMIAVMERTPEFGVLRAVGWKSRHVIWLVLGEVLCFSIIGSLIGIGLSKLVVWFIATQPETSFVAVIELSWYLLAKTVLITILAGFLGVFYPVVKLLRLQPSSAFLYV